MRAADIAHALNGRKSGAGYIVNCVAHEDRNPSLSIADGTEGQLLIHCHAGCKQREVIDALKAQGLWPEKDPAPQISRPLIVEVYDYCDEKGVLLYQVVRYQPKDFKQRRPDGAGGWLWNIAGARRVPYRLPELIEAAIVFIAEGERDCEALRDFGFCATCNSGGAGKWLPEYNHFFAGKEVCILPDADPPGWNHALDVARNLLGIAAKIHLLELPGAKDAAEWFERGHSELELIELVESPCRQ